VVKNSNTGPTAAPLESVNAKALILDTAAHVSVTQVYVNNSQWTVDAQYIFPLHESAAVSAFEAIVDGRVVKGVVQEKKGEFLQWH